MHHPRIGVLEGRLKRARKRHLRGDLGERLDLARQPLHLRDVPEHHHERAAAIERERHGRKLDLKLFAVWSDQGRGATQGNARLLLCGFMVLDGRAQGVAGVGRHGPIRIAAQELVGPVAGDPAGGGICVHDALVLIYEDHGVQRGLEGTGQLGQRRVGSHQRPPLT